MTTKKEVLEAVLAKKELQDVEPAFANNELSKFLRQNPLLAKKLSEATKRSKAFKQVVKGVRAVLRRNVGLFAGNPRHRDVLLAELRQSRNPEHALTLHEHLLATHLSTQERLPHYSLLYDSLFSITGRPESILDIGSGLNPVSFPFTGLPKSTRYVAVDVDRGICSFLNKYFSAMQVSGEARVLDALQTAKVKKLPKSDVAFVFKFVELVERSKSHKPSEELIKAIPTRWVVVSFPTLTAAGKPMRVPRRKWVELMLKRLGWEYKIVKIPNEIFYVIKKQA